MTPAETRQALLAYSLSLPDAYEDHPWGESVAKVGKKVFVFFGIAASERPAMTVKLRDSQPLALAQPGAEPSGYGLGKAGWVTIHLTAETPYEMLREWVEESYRTIAPRRLSARVSAR